LLWPKCIASLHFLLAVKNCRINFIAYSFFNPQFVWKFRYETHWNLFIVCSIGIAECANRDHPFLAGFFQPIPVGVQRRMQLRPDAPAFYVTFTQEVCL